MSPFRHRKTRHHWSLFLIVTLLLHATFGACEAVADTLCLEASGLIVLEQSGQPCVTKEYGDKSCVDLQLHDDHAPIQCKMKLVSADAPGVAFALIWPLPASARDLTLPDATAPPVPLLALIVRKTLYLLI